jgi:hypothetical protein
MADFHEKFVESSDGVSYNLSNGVCLPILNHSNLPASNLSQILDSACFAQKYFRMCPNVRKEHPQGPLPQATRIRNIEHSSIRGKAEWVIARKIRLWQSKKVDNHTAQLDLWPATSTEPKYSNSVGNHTAIKLFVFKDDHTNSDHNPYLVPVKYTPTRLEAPVDVRINGEWIPLEDWVGKTFARPKPAYDEIDNRIFREFSERHGGKKLNFLEFPLEVREMIYDLTFPESIVAYGFRVKYENKKQRNLFSKPVNHYKYPLGSVNRQLRFEFNRRIAHTCVITFTRLEYMEKTFRQANFEWLNQIRHVSLEFTTYTELFDLFGARISDDFRRIASWVAPLFRHMSELRDLSLSMPMNLEFDLFALQNPMKRRYSWGRQSDKIVRTQHEIAKDLFQPQMFHKEKPCQKTAAGWVLEAAFPWICHIPKLLIRFVKLSQLAQLDSLQKQVFDMGKFTKGPPVTKHIMRNARNAVHRATDGYKSLLESVRAYRETVNPTLSVDQYGMLEKAFHPERIPKARRKLHKDENHNMKMLYWDFNHLARHCPVERYWISGNGVANVAPTSFRAEL